MIITPDLYHPLYVIIISILTMILAHRYYYRSEAEELISTEKLPIIPIFITIILVIAIGFRPLSSSFIDMLNYNEIFNFIKTNSLFFSWDWDCENLIFDNLFTWCAITFKTPIPFFFIMAFIYFGGIFIACRRLFPGNTLAALLTYLGALSTFSYGVNGIKAGAAASVFLIAISYYNNKWLLILLSLTSYGLHHSMQLCIVSVIIALIYKNPKFYLFLWVVCFFISLFHITFFQGYFASMTDDQGYMYLSEVIENQNKGLMGFRIDFILYSFAPIAIGIYALSKGFQSGFYNFIFSVYLITNSVWLLCIYANYTNRIAYLSWLLLPVLLVYPILHPSFNDRRFKIFSFVSLAHVSFTLFMHFVYYA